MRKHKLYAVMLISMLFMGVIINAQGAVITEPSFKVLQETITSGQDTIPVSNPEIEINKIMDIRTQHNLQNSTYSKPSSPSNNILRLQNRDKLEMSPTARYWINSSFDESAYFPSHVTFKDTVICNPLFLPLIAKGNILPENYNLYDPNFLQSKSAYDNLHHTDSIFKDKHQRQRIRHSAYAYVRRNMPTLFKYSEKDLPKDIIIHQPIFVDITSTTPLKVEDPIVNIDDYEGPPRFIPERLYWTSAFESAIQFSQNYVSPNWNKGGSSNLNLFTSNNFKYNYSKDKVQITNEAEVKISVYTAAKDTMHRYNIGDNILRLRSNIGYRAFDKWYYTFDAEFRTQLFKNYKENEKVVQTALLSPMTVTLGIGMRYDLEKKFADKYKNLKLSVNMAPASYTYMYSAKRDIDLGRHGFKQKPDSEEYYNSLSQFGSTIRTDLAFNFNRNVSWQSRFYYFTSYDRVVSEFENTLTFAISRFFSTRIYFHLRYDDGVTKKEDFDSYFQLNELLSFGFNYKW